MLVLKLIRLNMGVNTTTEIVENLFKHFKTLDTTLKYSESLDTLASFRTIGGPNPGPPSTAPSSIMPSPSRPHSPPMTLGVGGGGGPHMAPGGGGGGMPPNGGTSFVPSLERRFGHNNSFNSHQGASSRHGSTSTVI